jgi:hypothetical protein
MKNLTTIMIEFGTNTTTIRVILANIRAWLGKISPPELSEIAPEASAGLLSAIEDQNNIGWDQWFRGRISIKWGELYNYDMKTPNILIQRPSSLRWGREIVTETLKFGLNAWYARNLVEHDTLGDPLKRRKEKLSEQIMWELNKEHNQSVKDSIPLDSIAALPVENAEMFLIQLKMNTEQHSKWQKEKTKGKNKTKKVNTNRRVETLRVITIYVPLRNCVVART